MKNYLLIIFLCFSLLSYSQSILNETDSATFEYIEKLKSNGVTKSFSMKTYCRGIILRNDYKQNCQQKNDEIYYITYVVWRFNQEVWIKKFDNCGAFKKIQLFDFDFDSKFDVTINELKTNNVREYNRVSHSCLVRFKFYNKKELVKTYFDLSDLTNKENNLNLNFEYNNNLEVVKLYEKINDIIRDSVFTRMQ